MENLERYFDDKEFLKWVFDPEPGLEERWERYISAHPDEKRVILLARRILSKFRTREPNLSPEEKALLFSKIVAKIREKEKKGRSTSMYSGILKYAAVALVFFSVGAVLFYRQNPVNKDFFSEIQRNLPEESHVARLVRPDGENIELTAKNSLISHQSDGKVVVNSDTVRTDQSQDPDAMNQLIIPYGKTSEILLADGTQVNLNAGSRLIYPDVFHGKNREVFLSGEAFFHVKSDESHPFIVQTSDFRVKAVGTQFNVCAYPVDRICEMVLAEGKIILEQNNASVFTAGTPVLPGHLTSYDRVAREIKMVPVNVENYILWKEGVLKFESTDLSRVVKRMERFYNIRIHFRDPLDGTIKISGKLGIGEECEEVIDRIARTASVRIINKGENLYEIL